MKKLIEQYETELAIYEGQLDTLDEPMRIFISGKIEKLKEVLKDLKNV